MVELELVPLLEAPPGMALPAYRVVQETGPAHAPFFVMAVAIEGYPEQTGAGRTKRLATQEAAMALLVTLEKP